jgi:glucokinase
VADIYDPEIVVIAGGVSESAPLFLDDARDHYKKMITGAGYRPLARIRTAQLGDDAAMVGAAALAADTAR